MEYENNEEMPDLAVLGTITIEVAGGSYNGTSAVGTRVKHKLLLSDEQRLKLVMKLPHILDDLISQLSVGLPERPRFAQGPLSQAW